MKRIILQQAYSELNDTAEYYEDEQTGLGLRMLDEFDKHVQRISPCEFKNISILYCLYCS